MYIYYILFVITGCAAQELSSSESQEFKINAVELSAQKSVSRIIGGSPTSIENFPYTVQILYLNQFTCGGSLLTTRHVLSAAHCFVEDNGSVGNPASFSIRAGTSALNRGGIVHRLSAIVVHERYNQPIRDNDVAVLLMRSSVTLSSVVQTAKIPAAGGTLRDNSTVVAVGWGRTSMIIPSASPILNEVSVRTVNRTVCAQRYSWLESLTNEPYPVTENMLCAGLLDVGGADACRGDSGGPLLYGDVVVGITSWGYLCAQPLFPGVYMEVSKFTTWINQTVSRFSSGSTHSQISITALLMPLVLAYYV